MGLLLCRKSATAPALQSAVNSITGRLSPVLGELLCAAAAVVVCEGFDVVFAAVSVLVPEVLFAPFTEAAVTLPRADVPDTVAAVVLAADEVVLLAAVVDAVVTRFDVVLVVVVVVEVVVLLAVVVVTGWGFG